MGLGEHLRIGKIMDTLKDKCRRILVKIAINNVEVQYCLFDEHGTEVLIDTLIETYGQSRIDRERQISTNHLATLQAPDYLVQQIAAVEEKLEQLNDIETVLRSVKGIKT